MSADPSDPTRVLEDESVPEVESARIEDKPTKIVLDSPRIEDTPTEIIPDTTVYAEDAEAATVLTDVDPAEEVRTELFDVAPDDDQTVVSQVQPSTQKTRMVESLQEEAPTQAELAIGVATVVQGAPARPMPVVPPDAMPSSAAAPVAKTRGNLTGTRLLNRYQVGDQLGVGGFGTVYRCRSLNSTVAYSTGCTMRSSRRASSKSRNSA